MWRGKLVSIHIAPGANKPMQSLEKVRALPGSGLEGDRYFSGQGFYSGRGGRGREVTLIESETVEAVKHEMGIEFAAGSLRRNLVTRGVPLNHLVDREFRIGEVVLRGVRLCEPCGHLESLTQHGLKAGLIHRGGLRAEVLTEGVLRVGDPVKEREDLHRETTTATEKNKIIVRRYYDELWNRWALPVADELLTTNISFRGSLGIETRGREGFKEYVALVRNAFPDFYNTIEQLVAEADTVVARLSYSGTHRGAVFGIAPTGKRIVYAGVAIFRFCDGKIAEGWVLGDTLNLLRQLGAAPPLPRES